MFHRFIFIIQSANNLVYYILTLHSIHFEIFIKLYRIKGSSFILSLRDKTNSSIKSYLFLVCVNKPGTFLCKNLDKHYIVKEFFTSRMESLWSTYTDHIILSLKHYQL